MFSRAPLAAAALLSAAGILLRMSGSLPLPVGGSIAALLLLSGSIPRSRSTRPSRLGLIATDLLLAAGFLALGGFCSAASDLHARHHVSALLAEDPGPIGPMDAQGTIDAEPTRRPPPEEGCSIDLALSRLVMGGAESTASGTVRVHVPPPPEGVDDPCLLGAGDRVKIATTIAAPRSFRNPGALDYSLFLRSRGIDAVGRSPSARLVKVSGRAGPVRRAITWTRRSILASIGRAFEASNESAAPGISGALLLGARDGIPRDAERTLQAAGTSHLLAVSGFNVAVIAGAIWLVLRRSRIGPDARSVAVAFVIGAYLLLTGREPSVERAVLGSLLYIAGLLSGRRVSVLNVVGAAGLVLLAANPAAVHDASFQLTFATTFGLAAFSSSLAGRIPGPAWIGSIVAVNVTAFAASAPLVAYLFNRLAPGAIPANFVASPLMALALLIAAFLPFADLATRALGTLGIVFMPGLAPPEALAWISTRAIEAVLLVSTLVARTPFLSLFCTTPPVWAPAGFLAAGAIAALAADRGRARSLCLWSACALGAVGLWPWERGGVAAHPASAPARDLHGLRATFLDVGQGSSALIESGPGLRLLMDGGGFARSGFDVGERVVGRALFTMGVRRLDAIAVSHGDFDHAGGLFSILEMFPGRELWISSASQDRLEMAWLVRRALACGRTVRLLERGRAFWFGDARVEVLHPPRGAIDLPDNDRSLVLRISAGGRSLILPGDIERAAEEAVAPILKPSDLLLAPHHGSRTSSTLPFVAAARPSFTIVSSGASNRWGHPHVEVIESLESIGSTVIRIDQEGAIRVELRPDELPAASRSGSSHPITARRTLDAGLGMEGPQRCAMGTTDVMRFTPTGWRRWSAPPPARRPGPCPE